MTKTTAEMVRAAYEQFGIVADDAEIAEFVEWVRSDGPVNVVMVCPVCRVYHTGSTDPWRKCLHCERKLIPCRPAEPQLIADPNQATVADYKEVLADKALLTRELDVLLNGEAGAAPMARLCDLVAQVKTEVGRAPGVGILAAAARYIWLRDNNAYFPEEEQVMGGEELDVAIDRMRALGPR